MDIRDFIIPPGTDILLNTWDANATGTVPDKNAGQELLKANRKKIIDLQERLYAENKQSLLVVFQAMDTGGKDGCIENVFKGVNPTGCSVRSFKVPTEVELAHDFLWRYHQHTPRNGMIQVFNRSHYEDVLIVRVKDLVPKAVWSKRYDHINAFERTIQANNTRILKFYLHIDKAEQKERLESRLEDPTKRWKYSSADLKERALWNDYQNAYEAVLRRCSTKSAPWIVVPANKKWFRDVVVSSAILNALQEMNPQYPAAPETLSAVEIPD